MKTTLISLTAVVVCCALVSPAAAREKRLGVLVADPELPNGTNVVPWFNTPPMVDSETLQIKIAKDYWFEPGDPDVQNWRGTFFFLHVLDPTEVNLIKVSTPVDLVKMVVPPGAVQPGSPITTSTGAPINWPIPPPSAVGTITFFPSHTRGGATIPPSGIKWTAGNGHTFPAMTLRFHAKNTDPANNGDIDIIAAAFNIFHGKLPASCCHIEPSDYLWVPQGFQLQSNCCAPHQGPGCDNPQCQQIVCQINPACCAVNWDALCAQLALQFCGELCHGPQFPDPKSFASPGAPDATGHWTHWPFPPQPLPESAYKATACGTVFIGIEHEGEDECPGDCNQDKVVDVVDLIDLLSRWGPCAACCQDINGDGVVSIVDLLVLLSNFGECPAPPNDECAGAIKVDRFEDEVKIVVPVEMYGATPSPDPYKCLPAPPDHKDVWYFLNNATTTKKLVTVRSDLGLFIEVNEGCACPPGPLVACGFALEGMVEFPMQPGECVTIRLIDIYDLPNERLDGKLVIENEPVAVDVNFYTDPGEFAVAVAEAGKVEKFFWTFKPDLLPPAGGADLDDPLDIITHGLNPDDPWGTLWPPAVDNVQFSANMTPQGPLTPRGVSGMAYVKAGFVPELTNNVLLANNFVDSFDIVSGPPAGDNHTALALDLISLDLDGPGRPVVFHVTVYDKFELELGKLEISALQGDKVFLGILAKDATIGRVDIWDSEGGAEGVTSIATYAGPPNPFGCPAPGPCCGPHPGPGCDDEDCCRAVCSDDPFCCTADWDASCAALAITLPVCACPLDSGPSAVPYD